MIPAPLRSRPVQLIALAGFLLPFVLPRPSTSPPDQIDPSATIEVYPTETPSDTPTATETVTPSGTDTETPSPTPLQTDPPTGTPTATESATPSPTETATPAATPSQTEAATDAPTSSPTRTPSPTPRPATPFPPLGVLINEVAWAGTEASASDEWIELLNPGPDAVDLTGWRLIDGQDIDILLQGELEPYAFYLLERTDDSTIIDVQADLTYRGSLSNEGDRLSLIDPSGAVVDTANADGGAWPAGKASPAYSTMERLGGDDRPGNWRTFTGCGGNGHDAAGNPIHGTPRYPNSLPCVTPTPTPRPPYSPRAVLVNEVAWSGTEASASDEWIELRNPGPDAVDLTGWRLTDGQDIDVLLQGVVEASAFYLLERTDDTTVADVPADRIYTGSLSNSGDRLWLLDPSGTVVDSANADGGGWPAGNADSHASMERRGGEDRSGNWGSFTGYNGVGHDADGHPIRGTPRSVNSVLLPIPTPTSIPSRLVVNEVLIRPHYDWEGTGGVSPADEFIELYNAGDLPVNLAGWMLDDIPDGGSAPFTFQSRTLPAGGFAALFRSRTHIALNDTGDTVRLLAPNGAVIDEVSYLRVRAYNLSFGRYPDGSHHLSYGLWPTAGGPNELFVEPEPTAPPVAPPASLCDQGRLHPLLPRVGRHAFLRHWLTAAGLLACR